MRHRLTTVAVALLTGVLVLLSPVSAFADDYLNAAVQALQNSKIYVSPEVQGIDTANLQQAIGNSDIAVAVLPAGAGTANGGTSGFLKSVAQQSNHDTVIVVVGGDLDAASRVLNSGEAGKLANAAEANNSNVNAALLQAIRDIQSHSTRTSTTVTPPQSPDSGVSVVGVGGGVLLALVLAIVGASLWRRRRETGLSTPKDPFKVVMKSAPEAVRMQMSQLRELLPQINDSHVQATLLQAIRDTENYFARAMSRAKKTGGKPDFSTANDDFSGTYTDLIQAITSYVDIQDYPRYYRGDTKKLLQSGSDAADNFAAIVLRAVQDGNTKALMEYQTSADLIEAKRYK